MPGYFSCTPEWLFKLLQDDFVAFCNDPNARDLLRVLFSLYHLREWLCPGPVGTVMKEIEKKAEATRSPKETLYAKLQNMPEFCLIRALCNHGKHFEYGKNLLDGKMHEYGGLRIGLARAGDRLNVTHFVVDGKEVRDVLFPVYRVYLEYFNPAPNKP
jgi:hypothetical protein